jgi:hypothetical protein
MLYFGHSRLPQVVCDQYYLTRHYPLSKNSQYSWEKNQDSWLKVMRRSISNRNHSRARRVRLVKREKEQAILFQQQQNLDCRARIPEEEIMIPAQDSWAAKG